MRIFRARSSRALLLLAGVWLLGLLPAGTALASVQGMNWWGDGHLKPQAMQAVALLWEADSHGLDPQDYGVHALERAVRTVAQGPAPSPHAIERLEQDLNEAMLRYLRDLRFGRVDPRQVNGAFRPAAPDAFDARAALREALDSGQLAQAVMKAAPPLPQYERLREALAWYRALQGHPAWHEALPALPSRRSGRPGKLEAGDHYEGLVRLAARLDALGDLSPASAQAYRSAQAVYDGDMAAAVRRFQLRHGLTADGVLGQQTLSQLAIAPSERVVQIELALERLRWTPLLQATRMVVVNIPEFMLRAYEQTASGIRVWAEMRVIVGKAMDTRTPLFDEDMRFIEFSPYWNVPPSIARGETVPRLRRDPGYLDRMGFEFVDRNGQVHTQLSDALLTDVLAGRTLLRQRPGPANALGSIKFVFPNRDHIYLHHTPGVALFQRDQRDFSHGCIRVEDPLALARFAMQDMPDWTEDRIVDAMNKGESRTVRLRQPVPVVIAYVTALVKNGQVHFFNDIYGHDRVLREALKTRRQLRQPTT